MATFHLHHSWFTNIIARILTAALTSSMPKSKQYNVTIIIIGSIWRVVVQSTRNLQKQTLFCYCGLTIALLSIQSPSKKSWF